MSDLISRQEAIEAIDEVDFYSLNKFGKLVSGATGVEEAFYKASDVYKALESIPSADKVGQVGKWIMKCSGDGWNDYFDFTCPKCGKKYKKDRDDILYDSNYCPNCGARMERRTDE